MDFILGGYFLINPAKRADCMDAELVPKTIYSVSDCICDVIPSTWNIDESNKRIKSFLDLTTDEFMKIEKWVTKKSDNKNIGWPYGFVNKATAIEFHQTFSKE